MTVFEKFYPDETADAVSVVDFRCLAAQGFRGVAFDIDNTLVEHDMPATEDSIQLFQRIHEAGLRICLLSNNHEPRVKAFADAAGADAYIYDAHKPKPEGYWRAAELLQVKREELIFFGDQLFTDIWGAGNAGIRSVLVKPVGPEKYFHIVLKRWLEKPVLLCYRRYHKKKVTTKRGTQL